MACKRKSTLPHRRRPKKAWGGALSGASQGAMLGGSIGGPWGAAAGFIGGAILGNRAENKNRRKLKRLNNQIVAERSAANERAIVANVRNDYMTDESQLGELELSNDQDMFMAKGGRIMKHTLPRKNSIALSNGAKLLTNNNGGTTGTHEDGNNIPIKRRNEVVAYGEPGEVVVDDVVLSKRLGFADKYLQLEDMKKSIIKEQKMLPKHNASLANKIIPSQKRPRALTRPLAFNGLDLMNIASGAGTVGNLIMSNRALSDQEGMIKEQMKISGSYRPTLNRALTYNDNVDVSDMTSAVDRGYATSTSGLDLMTDPTTASALKNTANVSRLSELSKIYGNRNRLRDQIRNQNTDIIRSTMTSNNAMIDEASRMRSEGQIQGLNGLIQARGQRVANVQGAISEFNTILNDRLMMESVSQRYANDLGERGMPRSMRTIKLNNPFKDKFENFRENRKTAKFNRRANRLLDKTSFNEPSFSDDPYLDYFRSINPSYKN